MAKLIGRILTKLGPLVSFAAAVVFFAGDPARVAAQVSSRITTTPICIQDGFGPAGDALPFDGVNYCFPTAESMLLSYLGVNGFNQIAPSSPTSADGLNLVEVMGGLMGTDPLAGTGGNWPSAIQVYLAAKGIGPSAYSLNIMGSPTPSQLSNLNQNLTAVLLPTTYFDSSGNAEGGHAIAMLGQGVNAQGQASPNTLVLDNPGPATFAPVADTSINSLQYLNTVATSGTLAADGALEWDPNQYPGFWGGTTGVIVGAVALTINPSQLSVNNPALATWTLSTSQQINLQNGYLSVLAPMTGPGGIVKGDGGMLELEAPNSTSGSNTIVSGTLQSDVAAGLPFGTGAIQLQAATLQLMPGYPLEGGGTATVSLTAASGAGNQLTFMYGATLGLSRNGNSSLQFTIGGNTNGTTANLARSSGSKGTLVIASADGTASLGGSDQVLVAGSGGNLPALTNGIVAPYIVAENNDTNGSGDFLTYGSNGFALAAYSTATSISSAGTSAVFEAKAAQSFSSTATAQVYALNVGPYTVSGGRLKVGSQTGGQAGLILNGGTISTTKLSFGSAEGLIYASRAGGTISSIITGSGSLTTFGPGLLTLTASNASTGAVRVNSGTLVAASTKGSATGSGAVTVQDNATLQVSGGAGGAGGTTLATGATLLLSGGTLNGALTMNTGSYLFGSGTITGSATIYGTIGSSTTDPSAAPYTGVENLKFTNGSVNLVSTTYLWRLNALDAAPADAGTNWSLLDFTNAGANLGLPGSAINLNVDFGPGVPTPNSGNAFWSQPHQWLIAEEPGGFNNLWWNFGFPAFSQGYFSASTDAGFDSAYIEYTPYQINGQWGTNGGGTWSGTGNWSIGDVPGEVHRRATTAGTTSGEDDGARTRTWLK